MKCEAAWTVERWEKDWDSPAVKLSLRTLTAVRAVLIVAVSN